MYLLKVCMVLKKITLTQSLTFHSDRRIEYINNKFASIIQICIGFVWMSIHALLLILIAKLIKAPYFFLAVGSQANVGGAASAPIVASAFHHSLATVGVLLTVFGYAVGTISFSPLKALIKIPHNRVGYE